MKWLVAFCLFSALALGQSHPKYPGQKHTESHGGTYSGSSSGSSHKGGTYHNPRTGDTYGKHKK